MKTTAIVLVTAVSLSWLGQAFGADAALGVNKPVAIVESTVPDTVMFATDELTDIQSRIGQADGEAGAGTTNAVESASLYLSSILYFGPTDWVIWVNGVPIEPQQDFQAFRVTDISPSSVELLVPLSALGMRPVRLGPNQTFIAKSGIVVEGRVQ